MILRCGEAGVVGIMVVQYFIEQPILLPLFANAESAGLIPQGIRRPLIQGVRLTHPLPRPMSS